MSATILTNKQRAFSRIRAASDYYQGIRLDLKQFKRIAHVHNDDVARAMFLCYQHAYDVWQPKKGE